MEVTSPMGPDPNPFLPHVAMVTMLTKDNVMDLGLIKVRRKQC